MLRELGKLFGSENRVKLLRYFLANQESKIAFLDLVKKVKITKSVLQKEVKNLVDVGFLNRITLIKNIEIKIKGKKKGKLKLPDTVKNKQVKEEALEFNKEYVLAGSLANLLLDFRFIDRAELLSDMRKFGKISLLCLGGVFFRDEEGKLDFLIVGDALNKEKIDNYIKNLEADLGTELRYAVFESEEFRYRVNMFDRLLKDFWKRPHEKIVENISTRP